MSIFDYDSIPMRTLSKAADLLLLSVTFAVCALPIVTFGAAQAGLYTAVKVFRDKEDDSSCFRAFFRGFKAGFGKITLVWLGYLLLALVMGSAVYLRLSGPEPGSALWLPLTALALLALLEPMSVQFHARYECAVWPLLKNSLLFFLSNPLRAILTAALTWFPYACAILLPELYALLAPGFILIYDSVAYLLCFMLMEKPFDRMVPKNDAPDGAPS